MNENMPRPGGTITPDGSVNLMRLYSQLAELASDARKIIRDGAAGTTHSRIQKTNVRIAQVFDEIRTIAQ